MRREGEVKWFLYGREITYEKLHEEEMRLFTIDEVIKYNPHAVFVPGNIVPSFIPGLKVEVFHGLPSTKKKKTGELYHYIIRGMFDLYCTQGPSSTVEFQQLAEKHGYFCIEETGWCKLDPLFYKTNRSGASQQKTILFASTFSPRYSKAEVLFPILLEMMQKYDIHWYVTLHPKMPKETVCKYKSINFPNVTFVESTELIDAFHEADMMLCDISSIIYEFLTLLKPVVTFQGDAGDNSLVNVENPTNLEKTILSVLENPSQNHEVISETVMRFHPYRDGKSSARVLDAVDRMLSGEMKPKKRKPRNLIRNFKLRRELGYWKL